MVLFYGNSLIHFNTPTTPLVTEHVSLQRKSDAHLYIPSICENYLVEHAEELGYSSLSNPSGCRIWSDVNATNEEIYNLLQSYIVDLDNYNNIVKNFTPIPDMMDEIKEGNYDVCSAAKLHLKGLGGLFPSNQLSLTKSGYVEPLSPPMRSHKFCTSRAEIMSMSYLVHDFYTMCLNLKPTSRRVLFDLGASLGFHSRTQIPIVNLLSQYEKFGFYFDHIYAFEITFTEPSDVYQKLLPERYFPAYHWINVGETVCSCVEIFMTDAHSDHSCPYEGVNPEAGNKMNPINSILESFDEDDFIVFKLDVDTPTVELPLALQILNGGANGIYHQLIDQFYFEHHVHLLEISSQWGSSMNGTIKDSLDLFYGLRSKGIPAHFWP